jgi:hypothetical protein
VNTLDVEGVVVAGIRQVEPMLFFQAYVREKVKQQYIRF